MLSTHFQLRVVLVRYIVKNETAFFKKADADFLYAYSKSHDNLQTMV